LVDSVESMMMQHGLANPKFTGLCLSAYGFLYLSSTNYNNY
jgi:hypothetical protein